MKLLTFLNASDLTASASGTYSALELNVVLSGVLLVALVAGLIISLSFLWVFERVRRIFKLLGKTFLYFLDGFVVCLAGFIIYDAGRRLDMLSEKGLFKPVWILYALVSYFVISGVGYVSKKIFRRIKANYQAVKDRG